MLPNNGHSPDFLRVMIEIKLNVTKYDTQNTLGDMKTLYLTFTFLIIEHALFQRYCHLTSFRSHHDLDLGYTSLGLKSALLIMLMDRHKQHFT